MDKTRALMRAIKDGGAAIHGAYVDACEAEGRALDPREIGLPSWCCDMLADAYDVMCEREENGWDT